MRLSRFILENLDRILQQWEDFARTLATGRELSITALRDDAEQMLRFVAADMETEQTCQQEVAKSTGHGPPLPPGESSAAHEHGVARAVDRFSLIELVSEYRALRASVTRMWIEAIPVTAESIAQLIRFNEAIDQILAEGVTRFTERLDYDAQLFTASISHDLANPVNAVKMSAEWLLRSRNLSNAERESVARIERASARLSGMLIDLRDFTRARLGGLVLLDLETCDVSAIVHTTVDELRAIYPNAPVVVQSDPGLVARVDSKRLAQLVSNLVANAIQHGTPGTEIRVRAIRDGPSLSLRVSNAGPPIATARLATLFDPLRRAAVREDDARLGLGLYIAKQIAVAHGGTIDVESTTATGTQFTVHLPVAPISAAT
jgi:signal transduction histidine kinase